MAHQRLHGMEFRRKFADLFNVDEETAIRIALREFLAQKAYYRGFYRYQSIAADILARLDE